MSKHILISELGYKKMHEELKELKSVQRPAVLVDLEEARQQGDLKENAEYHAAKEKLGLIDQKIGELEYKIANAKVVEETNLDGKIGFGSVVTVFNEKLGREQVYTIVSSEETDISKLKISMDSPVGKALIDKSLNDTVVVKIPSGEMNLKILKIE